MKLKVRILVLGTVALCGLAGLCSWWYTARGASPGRIASSGGAALDLPGVSDGPYYLQFDAPWATDTIGGSGELLSQVGCTVCSLAMASSDLGYEINPKEMNARLIHAGGYTSRGWIIWSKVSECTEGKVGVRVSSSPTHEDMDKSLQTGNIPIVKFFLPGGMPHWVAVVGKNGKEYLIKDPLLSSKKVVKLSDRTKSIVAVRYVEKR
jgi:hypothetical protein